MQVHTYVCAYKYSCTLHSTLRVKINQFGSWPSHWIDSDIKEIFKHWRALRKHQENPVGGWEGCPLCGMKGIIKQLRFPELLWGGNYMTPTKISESYMAESSYSFLYFSITAVAESLSRFWETDPSVRASQTMVERLCVGDCVTPGLESQNSSWFKQV